MNKDHSLKKQIFISIGLAVLIIIGSSIYLFTSLSNFSNYNSSVVERVQHQLETSTRLNYNLFILISETQQKNSSPTNKQHYINLISRDLIELKELTDENNSSKVTDFFKHTEYIINITIQKNDDQSKASSINWTIEQEKTVLTFNSYIESIIHDRNTNLANNEIQFNRIKHNTIFCIVICLLVIIYAIYKFYVVIKNLEKTTSDLKKINQEFDNAKVDIENTNWILENNTLITDNIRGLDDTLKIGQITLKTLNDILPVHAATIYIRQPDSFEFHLSAQIGTNKDNVLPTFQIGEGYLGKVVDDKKLIINYLENSKHFNTSSSLIKEFQNTIFICPLIHDNTCLGLIEIALNSSSKKELEKLHHFFQRISNTIASKIKFGQSHRLVEQLLEETQRQTHELEAQQEELRIANEELIYKTNLLESSEEELSVQQEELSNTNNELTLKASELEKRNNELNLTQRIVEQKIKEVELASQYKSEFMANMSHELRTPLNSILILAKLLQSNKLKNLTPEQIKYASVIHGAGTDLLDLINDLLDLAKIESGTVELLLEKVTSRSFVKNITELFNAIAKEKEITFKASIDKSVPKEFITDENRLQQVIKNFLSNAFKFTDKEGQVFLSIHKANNDLYFQVKDTGKGITQEKQNLIFEAFKQEDGSTSRRYGGTGLGLSISKQIASLLSGQITLQSEVGKGSTFTLVIPLVHETNDEYPSKKTSNNEFDTIQEPQEKTLPNNSANKLLIIEDDINFASILKDFAEENGYSVSLAHDGLKGIELANEIIPDAIILDIILPLLDGWTVIKTLKNDPRTCHIPVHMMSGTIFDKDELFEKGAIGFMHKPVTKEIIQHTFDSISSNIKIAIKKVLYIENKEIQEELIKKTFTKQNIQIIQEFTIQNALERLKSEVDFDCIILDLQFNDADHLEIIKKIKENPELIDIPIIISTANKLTEDQHKQILDISGTTIIKSEKLNEDLIDEVNLFLNRVKKNNTKQHVLNKTNPPYKLAGKTVLIADDDMRNIFALSTSLQSYDMKIEIATTGKEALEIIKKHGKLIDIVLMDIMMPEMDGHEAIHIIRNDLNLKNLPILAVTAKAMKGDREKSIQSGANDYISKPIDINKLTSLMNVWLS